MILKSHEAGLDVETISKITRKSIEEIKRSSTKPNAIKCRFLRWNSIAADNPVRVIDAFVSFIPGKGGLSHQREEMKGARRMRRRCCCGSTCMATLNRIRSSWQLENCRRRNINCGGAATSTQLQSDRGFFAEDNPVLKGVFQQLNQLCLDMDLFGRELSVQRWNSSVPGAEQQQYLQASGWQKEQPQRRQGRTAPIYR